MSTNDVPGAREENHDELAAGCWAEHEDGSLVLVESTEASRVIFSVFDMAREPIVEWRGALPEVNFKKRFSWNPSDPASVKWTWHDKTPFPWDRVIAEGAEEGVRYASARDQLTAAARVAESLNMRAQDFHDRPERRDQSRPRLNTILGGLQTALNELNAYMRDGE